MDIERMDPRRWAGRQINVSSGRDSGTRDCWLMRATRPGSRATANAVSRSACPTPGHPRGLWRDTGQRQDPERGPEYERRPSTHEGTGDGCGDGRSIGAAIRSFGPGPSAPPEGGRTAGTQRMKSWLQGGPTGDVCGILRGSC